MHNSSYLIRERDSRCHLRSLPSLSPRSPPLVSTRVSFCSPSSAFAACSPPVRAWCGLCKAGACLSEIPLLSATPTHTEGRAGSNGEEQSRVDRSEWRRPTASLPPVSPAPLLSFLVSIFLCSVSLGGSCELVRIAFCLLGAPPPLLSPLLALAPPPRLIGQLRVCRGHFTVRSDTFQNTVTTPSCSSTTPPLTQHLSSFVSPARALAGA